MLPDEFRRRVELDLYKFSLSEIRNVIDDMLAKNIDLGSTLYKICPKCNENHDGNCNHCAWQGTMRVCDVGVRVWQDGSYCKHNLQIVERKFGNSFDFDIFRLWNIQYFASKTEAEIALRQYEEIRSIEDKDLRKERYDEWEANRRSVYVDSIMPPDAIEDCSLIKYAVSIGEGKPQIINNVCEGYQKSAVDDEPREECKICNFCSFKEED